MTAPTLPLGDLAPVELLLTHELCERFRVHRVTVARWVEAGRISPAKRIPGRHGAYVFTAAEVERFAATYTRRRTS